MRQLSNKMRQANHLHVVRESARFLRALTRYRDRRGAATLLNASGRSQHVKALAQCHDHRTVNNRDVQLLECKTAGEFGTRLWRDGVPEYVQLQVQHRLAVTGKQAADVSRCCCAASNWQCIALSVTAS
jgi:hypothetical protein